MIRMIWTILVYSALPMVLASGFVGTVIVGGSLIKRIKGE